MFKKIISTVLTLCMVLTCVSVGVVSASAAEGLTVQCTSNYFPEFTQVVPAGEDLVTVSYCIQANKDLVNTEWYLTYDNTKLYFDDDDNTDYEGELTIMPYAPNAIINTNVGNRNDTICGNDSSVSSLGKIKSTDGKSKTFVTVTFQVIGTGTATVDLQLRNLTLGTKDTSTGLLDPASEEAVVSLYEEEPQSTAVENKKVAVYEGYYDSEKANAEESGEDSSLTVKSYSLSLASNIEMNFKVLKSTLTGYTDPSVVVTMNGEETTVDEYTESGDYYVFNFNKIYPQLIGDDVTAVLHAKKNGADKYGPEYTRSVIGYCNNQFAKDHGTYGVLHTLLVNLLNYGAAAQNYTGYKTNALCNAALTATQKSWALTDLGNPTNYKNMHAVTISNPTVNFNAGSLSLGSTVGVSISFTTDNIANKTVVATIKGTEYTYTSEDFEKVNGYDSRYKVVCEELYANDMNEPVSFTVYQNGVAVSDTATYSISSYVANHKDDTGVLGDLLRAMYLYGEAAKAM